MKYMMLVIWATLALLKVCRSTYLISAFAGQSGTTSFCGDGGLVTSSCLNNPNSVFVNTVNTKYIGECSGNRVRKVNNNNIISTFAGGGSSVNEVAATNAGLNCPGGVWEDSMGKLYVSNFYGTVQIVDTSAVIHNFAGNGIVVTVYTNDNGDGGPATSAGFATPTRIMGDTSGNMYISDYSCQKVRKVSTANIISTVTGIGTASLSGDSGPASAAAISSPIGIFVSSTGEIFLSDTGNNRIRKITSGQIISTIAGKTGNTYSGDGYPATSTFITALHSWSDSAGVMYFSDNYSKTIRMKSTAEILTTIAGGGSTLINDVSATNTKFINAYSIGGDSTGKLYAVDNTDMTVRLLTNISPTVTPSVSPTVSLRPTVSPTIGPSPMPSTLRPTTPPVVAPVSYYITAYGGTSGSSGSSGDGGRATAALLSRPFEMFLNTQSDLYFADIDNNKIRKIDSSGIITKYAGTGSATTSGNGGAASNAGVNYPTGVWGTSTGVMYIVQITDSVVRSANNGIINYFAGTLGSSGFSGDGGQATSAQFYTPYIVWGDSVGSVYIADENGSSVRKVVASTGIITSYVGVASCGFYGDGGAATSAGICGPRALNTDSMGTLYVCDVSNNRIRKVSSSGIISTVIGSSQGGANTFNGDGQAGTSTSLNYPNGIYCDSVGVLYVADQNNYRLRMLTLSNTIFTIAGTGISGSTGNNGPASSATFSEVIYPVGDTVGTLYIADAGVSCIRKLINISPTVKPTVAPSAAPSTTHPTVPPVSSPAIYYISTYAGTGTFDATGDGGKATAATLRKVLGMFLSTNSDLYFADIDNSKVRKIDSSNIITTVGGTGTSSTTGNGGAFSSASLKNPLAVWCMSTGVLFVTQYTEGIVSYVSNGVINIFAGQLTTYGYAGDGGQATAATFLSPTYVWGDSVGNVFMVDESAASIRKVVFTSRIITTYAGQYVGGFSGDGGQATVAKFYTVRNIYIDTAGILYVCDNGNHRVRKIAANGIITTIIGTTEGGANTFNGNGLPGTSTTLNYPNGPFVDSNGVIYFGDLMNQRLRLLSLSGLVYTYAGTGSLGAYGPTDSGPATSVTFYNPYCNVGDSLGVMYTSAEGSATIRKVINISPTVAPTQSPSAVPTSSRPSSPPVAPPNTYYITAYVGNGSPGSTGDGGPATAATIYRVLGLFVSTMSELYLANIDENKIRKVDASNIITAPGGDGTTAYKGDGGPWSSASINYPFAVWGTSLGTMYITHVSDLLVRSVSPSGIISSFAGVYGVRASAGNGGPATSAFLNSPVYVWGDSSGAVYISEAGGELIRKVSSSGIISTFVGTGAASFNGDGGQATAAAVDPYGLYIDSIGVMYFCDNSNSRVRKVATNGIISTVVGNSQGGGYNGDGQAGTSTTLTSPVGVFVDSSGVVYFTDYQSFRVRMLSLSNIVYTIAGTGNQAILKNNGPASSASFYTPYGIAGDTQGTIYISEGTLGEVRKLVNISPTMAPTMTPSTPPVASPTSYYISVYSGTGTPGFAGDGGKATSALMSRCLGMFLSTQSDLYYSEIDYNRIRKVSSGSIITTVGGTGPATTSGDGGAATSATIYNPVSVWGTSTGALYITQINDAIVRWVNTAGIIKTFAGVYGVFGTTGDGGPATSANFCSPYNVWGDSIGNVFVTDEGCNIVRKIVSSSGIISRYAGTSSYGFSGDFGPATSAYLKGPRALYVDSSGVMYICDRQNQRVRKVSSAGIITTIIGTSTGGSNTFNGDGQAGTSTNLNDPNGVYVDSTGIVFFADLANCRLRFLPLSGRVYTYAGTGVSGATGNNGPASSATFTYPYHTVGDTTGVLYIADAGTYMIRKLINITPTVSPTISPTSAPTTGRPTSAPVSAPYSYTITAFAGTGTSGNSGDGGSATAATLNRPYGVFVNSAGALYLADYDNARIRMVSGGSISTQGGQCTSGSSNGAFYTACFTNPLGLWGNSNGVLYIADPSAYRVAKVSNGIVSTFAGTGTSSSSGDGGQATSASFGSPYALTGDTIGSIYVSDVSNTVRKITTDGIINCFAGMNSGYGYSSDSGVPTSMLIYNVFGIFTDTVGGVFFSDTYNHIIRKVSNNWMTRIVGVVQVGDFNGDGQAGTTTMVLTPSGIWLDSSGVMYFADSNNRRVRMLSTSSIVYTIAGSGTQASTGNAGPATSASFVYPFQVAGDTVRALYVSDINAPAIRQLINISPTIAPTLAPSAAPSIVPTAHPTSPPVAAPSSYFITSYAGDGVQTYGGDTGLASEASFILCLGIFESSIGELYIADNSDHRIRKVDPFGIIWTVGGNGSPAFSGNGGALSSASFSSPVSIWGDSVGTLYISERYADVRKVSIDGIVNQFAGTGGTQGTSGDGGAATSALFQSVYNVWGNTLGVVYISDDSSQVVRAVSNGIITRFAGSSIIGFSGDAGAATSATLSYPESGFADTLGRVFIGDRSNNRIRKVASGVINTVVGTFEGGSGSFNGDGLPGTSSNLNLPNGIWLDSSGALFIADTENSRVRVMISGRVYTIAGNGNAVVSGDNGPATDATFISPFSLTGDSVGRVFVGDYSASMVRLLINISPTETPSLAPSTPPTVAPTIKPTVSPTTRMPSFSPTIITLLPTVSAAPSVSSAPTFSPGKQKQFLIDLVAGSGVTSASIIGDGGPAVSAFLNAPNGIWQNSTTGVLYVGDSQNNRVRRFSVGGTIATFAGTGAYSTDGTNGAATSAAVNPTGVWGMGENIFLTESGIVRKVSVVTGIISLLAGTGTSGYSGDGGPATSANVIASQLLTSDTQESIYICEYSGHRVRKIALDGIISTYAGNGGSSYLGEGLQATASSMSYPLGIWVDPQGNGYITLANNMYRIFKVDTNGVATTFIGLGIQSPVTGEGVPASATRVTYAYGIWGDTEGNIYYSDRNRYLVRQVTATTNIVYSVAGIGAVKGSTGDGGQGTAATLNNPSALFGTSSGVIYIADTYSYQIRRLTDNSPTVSPTIVPSQVPSVVPTVAPSAAPTQPPSVLPSVKPSVKPTVMPSTVPTVAPTVVPSIVPTVMPSILPSVNPSIAPTAFPTISPSTTPSIFPSVMPSAISSVSPTTTQPSSRPTRQPTRQPSMQPSRQPSTQPSTQPSAQPSTQPFAKPTSHPSGRPTAKPSMQPSSEPSRQPSSQPSVQPSCLPNTVPTRQPTTQPTTQPSTQPITRPSRQPTNQPTSQPSGSPSARPSCQPISFPSSRPSSIPTIQPFSAPTVQPSRQPTSQPSRQPSRQPASLPSMLPTVRPTCIPSSNPSVRPSHMPSNAPSTRPTMQPMSRPSSNPESAPSTHPTSDPSIRPSRQPSSQPSSMPTRQPLSQPTSQPTSPPSCRPTTRPSAQPTSQPSRQPNGLPSAQPSTQPTSQPTRQPLSHPTSQPSRQPMTRPSSRPSKQPSSSPSAAPTSLSHFISAPKATLPSDNGITVSLETPFKIVLPFSQVGAGSSAVYTNIGLESALFGSSYVLLGNDSFPSSILTASGNPALYVLNNAFSSESHGRSVSLLKDFNRDSRQDLIIGDPYAARCYVLFGKNQGLVNMTDGFTIFGEQDGELTGWSVSDAGDVNNDTIHDIVIGAPNAATSTGAVYVIYGGARKQFFDIYLNNLTASQGFAMYGGTRGDYLGLSVSNVGDFNGDKCDDVIVGAMITSSKNAGAAYVLFGCEVFVTNNIQSQSSGYKLSGTAFNKIGYSVSGAGDVNKDGFRDILVSSNPTKASLVPTTYLIFGSLAQFEAISVSNLGSLDGIRISGVGGLVNCVGDINQDGFADVMMSSVDNSISGYVVTNVSGSSLIRQIAAASPTPVPTTAPTSSKPTRCPTLRPTFSPSVVKPTANPSFAPSNPTEFPTMGATSPSSRPSSQPTSPTSRPTEVPTVVTLEPTEEPVWHSVEPSEEPSEIPTSLRPTIALTASPTIAATDSPSANPTTSPSSLTRRPFNLPTPGPTVPPTSAALITVDISGLNTAEEYVRLSGVVEYVFNTTNNVTITGTDGAARFVVIPSPKTLLLVEYFNITSDVIDLTHFTSLHKMKDLSIRAGSVIVDLSDGQMVRLQNLQPSNVTDKNFIFAPRVESNDESSHAILIASIVAGVAVAAVGLLVVCVCMAAARSKRVTDSQYEKQLTSRVIFQQKKVLLMSYDENLQSDGAVNQLHLAVDKEGSDSLGSYRLSQFSVDSEGELVMNAGEFDSGNEEEEEEEDRDDAEHLSEYSLNSRGSFVFRNAGSADSSEEEHREGDDGWFPDRNYSHAYQSDQYGLNHIGRSAREYHGHHGSS